MVTSCNFVIEQHSLRINSKIDYPGDPKMVKICVLMFEIYLKNSNYIYS